MSKKSTVKAIERRLRAVEDTRVQAEAGTLLDQLNTLYEDRERLHRELGVADPDGIIRMVRSLTDQLDALYREKDEGLF